MTDRDRPPGIKVPGNPAVPCGTGHVPAIIEPLTGANADEAARLYVEVFLADEPTSSRISPDSTSLILSAGWYVRALARRNLSFIARDSGTNEIAGIIFSFDITDDFGGERAEFEHYLSHFNEAVVMIDALEEQHLDLRGIRPGSVLHAFQGAVGRDYRGKDVMKALVKRTIVHGRQCGFSRIVADCTNSASRNILSDCGFFEVGFSPYNSFYIDGVRFFEGLEGGISLMVMDL